MHQLEKLTTYQDERIGREFSNPAMTMLEEQRRHQSRRSELLVAEFKDALRDSTSLPKLALTNTCRFEAHRARCDAFMTWVVTIFLAIMAGTICALVINHLHI